MFPKNLLLALIALAAVGCASTSRQRHMDALRDVQRLDFEVIVSEKDGLTKRGCRIFFPDVAIDECHTDWHRRDLGGKLAYLKEKGSSTMRGVWQSGRNAAYEEQLQEKVPQMTAAQIAAEINKLGDDTVQCSKEEDGHVDVCIFMLATIATPSEAFMANQTAALMEAQARAWQQSMMRMHRQPLRPPPLRRK